MKGFTIKAQRIYSTKNIVRCKVCHRQPRKNRLVYEITHTNPDNFPPSYVFHDGFTDTIKCAEVIVLQG